MGVWKYTEKIKRRITRPSWKSLLIAIVLLVAILIATYFIYLRTQYFDVQATEESLHSRYVELRDNSEVTDQVTYYAELASAAESAGEYEAALDATKKRQQLIGPNLKADEYRILAQYYCRLDDKDNAIKSLERVNAASDDFASITLIKETINREGCAKWVLVFDQQ